MYVELEVGELRNSSIQIDYLACLPFSNEELGVLQVNLQCVRFYCLLKYFWYFGSFLEALSILTYKILSADSKACEKIDITVKAGSFVRIGTRYNHDH